LSCKRTVKASDIGEEIDIYSRLSPDRVDSALDVRALVRIAEDGGRRTAIVKRRLNQLNVDLIRDRLGRVCNQRSHDSGR
jgi:hypothetical protein